VDRVLVEVLVGVIMDSKKVRQDRKRHPRKKSQKFQSLARSRWEKRSLSDDVITLSTRGNGEFVVSTRETAI